MVHGVSGTQFLLVLGWILLNPSGVVHSIAGTLHGSEVYASKIFADYPQGKQLRTGKNRDCGCQERKPWHGASVQKVPAQHIEEDYETQQGESKTYYTCHLQRQNAEPGNHVRSEEHTSELQSLRHLVCRL